MTDADLIVLPLRIVVGAKSLANGQVEWSYRSDRERRYAHPEAVSAEIASIVASARNLGMTEV